MRCAVCGEGFEFVDEVFYCQCGTTHVEPTVRGHRHGYRAEGRVLRPTLDASGRASRIAASRWAPMSA